MSYQSNKQRVKTMVENQILTAVKEKDLEYDKVIQYICSELGINENAVKEVLRDYVAIGLLKEIHVLTIPDKELDEFFLYMREKQKKEKQFKKELDKEMQEIEKGVKNS